jgi:hypothetical protein
MYNINFKCTYLDIEHDSENDDLYRENLLSAFGIPEFDELQINSAVHDLFVLIEQHVDFNNFIPILAKLASNWFSEDIELGFVSLFSYHYFYITHELIVRFIGQNVICDKMLRKLTKLIN